MTRSAEPEGTSPGAADHGEPGFAGLAAEIRRLRSERASRHLTDLATGVLAAQLGVSTVDAAEHLSALAAATGLSAEDLAADVVNALGAPTGTSGSARPEGRTHARSDIQDAAPGGTGGEASIALARRLRRTAAAAETADDVGEAARTLLEGGLGPLGADGLWLWRFAEAGCLRLAGHAGVGATEAVAWGWIPPAAPEPIRAALDGNSPVWLADGCGDVYVLPGTRPGAAQAVLPLRRRGSTAGIALVGWPGPVDFDPALRRAVAGLMDVIVTVLDRPDAEAPDTPVLVDLLDALTHPAALLHTGTTADVLVVEHANEAAATALGNSLQTDDRTLTRVFPYGHAALDRLARRARHTRRTQHAAHLPLVGPTGEAPEGAAPEQRVPEEQHALLDVRVLPAGTDRCVLLWHTAGDPGLAVGRAVARLQSVATFQDSLTGGDTVWSEQAYGIFGMHRDEPPLPLLALRARVHQEDGEALTVLLKTLTERRSGAQTVLRVVLPEGSVRHVRVAAEPLLDGNAVTGFVGVYQDVSATRRTELALTATFDHLNAVRSQAELRHQLALQLQQAIVPEATALRELPGGLTVAARYRPAAEEYQVGGDWYDVLALPTGKVLLAVGDIAGHGIDSVTGMVALRNAQRALAFTGRTPGRLMGWLNEVTLRTGGGSTATAVCALYDPEDGGLVWSSAGHLPLLLIRAGHARLLEPPQDILLGAVPSYAYEERRTELEPGDTLLFYTDGLVERRHEGLGPGLARLLAVAGRLADRESPELLVDALLGTALGDTDDDTSVVAVRLRRPGEVAPEGAGPPGA
ncbi:SpoIIE family protein phosphatase [Streptomyces sp. NPDC012637]|uniref:SpoIIE family protein phosphatase n=1 Tax=Streptomyces sp. NPDC012637 TaxID=3364842 RepID=UPI0036E690D5